MNFDVNLLLKVLLYAFYGVAGIQIFYYLFIFSRIIFVKRKKKEDGSTIPVTIVICAKNELENLQKNLPAILEQNYPNYEVIVVNDNSQDGSNNFLSHLKSQYAHLKVIDIFARKPHF